jgi:hypothetical protein
VPLIQECVKSCNMKTRWEGNYSALRYSGHNGINNNSNNNNMFDDYTRPFMIMITHRVTGKM